MPAIISVQNLTKTYRTGLTALRDVSLDIREGEILALLGPNGAGKTTLISIICGLVRPTSGRVTVGGHDIIDDYRASRALIGLVPQELKTEAFETVWDTVTFSRGLFGKARNPALIRQILEDLSLADKRDARIMTLSGGMKRRVMIAKALSHEPAILFLDEPSAGVDVELRKGMWAVVERLRRAGVTIILTTHYIEEAEEIADRVAIIDKGAIIEVDEKAALMRRLGKQRLVVSLAAPATAPPAALAGFDATISPEGDALHFSYEPGDDARGVAAFVRALSDSGVVYTDLKTEQSSLEEIFVDLVNRPPTGGGAGAAERDEPGAEVREEYGEEPGAEAAEAGRTRAEKTPNEISKTAS